jgi:hypothetical protein
MYFMGLPFRGRALACSDPGGINRLVDAYIALLTHLQHLTTLFLRSDRRALFLWSFYHAAAASRLAWLNIKPLQGLHHQHAPEA